MQVFANPSVLSARLDRSRTHSQTKARFAGSSKPPVKGESPGGDDQKPPAKSPFQRLILGLTLLGAGAIGYNIYKNTPHNPPVVAVDDIPLSRATKTLEGVVMPGVEPGSFIIRDMKSQKIYSLRGIDSSKLSQWFQDGARASVWGTRRVVEEDGVKRPGFLVDTIDPAALVMEPPKVLPFDPSEKKRPETMIHLQGVVSFQEGARGGVWSLMDDKTGESLLLSGHTDQKLSAWFRPNVAVKIEGKDSQRPDNIMQGIPFNVERIFPVQLPPSLESDS